MHSGYHVEPNQIKSLRLRLGMRQIDLAQTLGVHVLTVSRWERGAVQPPAPMVKLLKMVAAQQSAKGKKGA